MPTASKRSAGSAKKSKAGRPAKKVDVDKLKLMASFGCTIAEMSAFFDIGESTLRRNYKTVIDAGKEQGKARLRKKQWESALAGNTTMLIWLGKQVLGQSEKQEVNATTSTSQNIQIDWGLE